MAAILVVEDDVDLRELLVELLAGAGHDAEGTGSGLDAVVRAARSRYELILLDVDLDELAGEAVARVVADLGPVPIVAVSGRSDGWQRRLLKQGVTACLTKPYHFDRLLQLVDAIVRLGRGHEAGWPTDVRALGAADLAAVSRLPPDEIDRLPFGAIAIGPDERITAFNDFEARSSLLSAPTVIGMRFGDLAPCTRVKSFATRLARGLRGQPLDDVVRFVFPYHGSTCLVSVRLYRDDAHDRVWVFVSRRPGLA